MQDIQQKDNNTDHSQEKMLPAARAGASRHTRGGEGTAAHQQEVGPTYVAPARFQMARSLDTKPMCDL